MSFLTKVQSAGIATLLLSMSIFLSRCIGLIRDKLISWNFGATTETDIYFIAFIIPDFINYLLAGGYFSIILVPLLTKYFAQGEREGYRFFSTILTTVTLTIIFLTIVLWYYTPYLVPYIAKNLQGEDYDRLTLFIRIILPGQIFFLSGAVLSALLYMRKQFLVPALMPLIYNTSIIIFGLLISSDGMIGYCYGVTIGAFFGAFLLPLYTVIKGGIDYSFTVRHKGCIAFLILALPLMLGQSITMLEEQFIRIFGSYLSHGVVSVLSYARRIMLLPVGVVAQAIGVASYPFLASMITNGKKEEFISTLRSALNNTLYFLIPLTIFMILMSEQIVAILFYGGEFTFSFVIATTPLLQFLLMGVPAWGIQQVLVRGFYAHNDTIKPTIVGTLVTGVSIVFYYYGIEYCDAIGVALASTLAITLYMFVLCIVWRVWYYKGVLSGLFSTFIITSIEVLPASVLIYVLSPYVFDILSLYFSEAYFWGNVLSLLFYGIVFGSAYFATLLLTKSPRYAFFYSLLRRVLGSR